MKDAGSSYNNDFYLGRHDETTYAASQIVSIVTELFPGISSAIDLGCGVGTFLLACKEAGAMEIKGVEGKWLQKENLRIPETDFEYCDLEKGIAPQKKYGLAICLEVAEHLSEEAGRNLVKSLCTLSDCVLFSAAIPRQGGIGHVNEAWQSHWASIFESFGFSPYDLVRKRIWSDPGIPFWYRQNIIIYSSLPNLPYHPSPKDQLDLVHPALYAIKCAESQSLNLRLISRTLAKLSKRIYRLSVQRRSSPIDKHLDPGP